MNPDQQTDYEQPVAYDKDGRPLYAHPPAELAHPVVAQPVHIARAVEPAEPYISEETIKRHEDSAARFPELNLSKNEYVIMEVDKHWIGTVVPAVAGCLLALLICLGLVFYPVIVPSGKPPLASLLAPSLLVFILIALGTYIPIWVYKNNRFFLTNESAIQNIQASLFSRQEQTVSLASIEDASFHQTGVLQLMLNYGTIRLSTIGDEDTYTFTYVSNPKEKLAVLNNAVEAFKNGRPVIGRG